jgi:hypothetical protein
MRLRNIFPMAIMNTRILKGKNILVWGTHQWYYDKGEWKEKKITPDKCEFTYATNKRKAWQAPEGSGVPVGTEYHWYLLAHQNVRKLDSNSYTTWMEGFNYKLALKRAEKGNEA